MAGEGDILEFEIVNWDKYQKATTKKRSWFSVDVHMVDRMLDQGFSAQEIGVWVWFLGRKCVSSDGYVRCNSENVRAKFGFRRKTLFFLMQKLQRFQCINLKSALPVDNFSSPTDRHTDIHTNRGSEIFGSGNGDNSAPTGARPGESLGEYVDRLVRAGKEFDGEEFRALIGQYGSEMIARLSVLSRARKLPVARAGVA